MKAMLRDALYAVLGTSLPEVSPAEAAALDALREEFATMPSVDVLPGTASEAAWADNVERLRALVAHDDPRRFLRWPVITETMAVNRAPFVLAELGRLVAHPERARWLAAAREVPTGHPIPCVYWPKASGNSIHHVHHVMRFEALTGRRVADLRVVVEFGGGYGSFARVLRACGFRGRHIIYDLPAFSALQRYYCRSQGLPAVTTSDANTLRHLTSTCGNDALFVATWSISETPLHVREEVMPLVAGFGQFLIGYQERFEEVDNAAYFRRWSGGLDGVSWCDEPVPRSPGNHYLIGARLRAPIEPDAARWVAGRKP